MDNKKIKNISFTDGEMNSIGYESLNEVFFDVFEIRSNGIELLKEKKGDFNGNPIIELDLNLENQIYKNVRFVLGKHSGVRINPKLLDHSNVMVYEEKNKKTPEIKKSLITEKKVVKPKQIQKPILKDPIIEERNLIKENKEEFYKSIREELIDEIKKEVRSGIIAELLKSNIKDNFDSFLKEESNQTEISTLFKEENEKFRKELLEVTQKMARREALRYTESGGGTNATQYANGGTMNGDLTITGRLNASDIHSQTFTVDDLVVDQHLVVKSLSAENEVVTQNLNIIGLLSAASAEIGNTLSANIINADVLFVNTLSTNNEFVIHNLSVTEGVSANNVLIYDSLSSINSIYTNYGQISNLEVINDATVSGRLSASTAIIDGNLITNNITANYSTINNDLSVLGELYANQASISNNLTIGGGISSYNGSYILGDVIITGNLNVSQEIFGDLVSGNTIVNSNGDTLLAKAVKTISGSSFTNGTYTVHHNLSTYDLLLTLYYVNPNGTREVVHASMINDTLSTTQISFGSQPSASDVYKLVIMS